MINNTNIKSGKSSQEVTFGRMKGNINLHDKIYKINDKSLLNDAISSYSKENIKNPLDCKLTIKKDTTILVSIYSKKFNIVVNYTYNYIPQLAQNAPLTKEKIIAQFNKTLDTPFVFESFDIELDDNLFIPVSVLNDIRRVGLEKHKKELINSFKRHSEITNTVSLENTIDSNSFSNFSTNKNVAKISLLLNVLNLSFDYSSLNNVDKLYIPLKYFGDNKYKDILTYFSNNFNLYIYMPTIIKNNYTPVALKILGLAFANFNIKGVVISHISQLELIRSIKTYSLGSFDSDENNFSHSKKMSKKDVPIDMVGNYTLNTYNHFSAQFLSGKNILTTTISPELDEGGILSICNSASNLKELIVYGNIPVMTTNYCLLGKSNKCYKNCSKKCKTSSRLYLKDRMNMLFRIIPDNSQTITTIYNSKTTSIDYKNFNIDFARIDILDESVEEINNIIETVKKGNRFEGKDYTNGNLKRGI